MTTTFGIGDLVRVIGYHNLFYIDSITEYKVRSAEAEWQDVDLDLTNAATGAYEFAFAEDTTLVCRARHAEEYMRTGVLTDAMIAANGASPPKRKLTADQQAEKIDALLDDAIAAKELYIATGMSEYQAAEIAAYDAIKTLQEGL